MVSQSLQYVQHIKNIMDRVVNTQYSQIDEASNNIVEAIKNNKCIYVFGASHAGIIAQEVFYRTGGLVPINPILPASFNAECPSSFTYQCYGALRRVWF
jgi:uncharacterized phosphosugar-binding protein